MVQNDKKKKKKREGSDAVITLDRVSKSYSSGSPALDNVSLTIKKGVRGQIQTEEDHG